MSYYADMDEVDVWNTARLLVDGNQKISL